MSDKLGIRSPSISFVRHTIVLDALGTGSYIPTAINFAPSFVNAYCNLQLVAPTTDANDIVYCFPASTLIVPKMGISLFSRALHHHFVDIYSSFRESVLSRCSQTGAKCRFSACD